MHQSQEILNTYLKRYAKRRTGTSKGIHYAHGEPQGRYKIHEYLTHVFAERSPASIHLSESHVAK